jgi:ribosomal-protein-serine acetyltransferase
VSPLIAELGDGAILRRYTTEDLESIFALVDANRDRLRRWLPWVDQVKTLEDERAWLEGILASESTADQGYGMWDRNGFAGGIGLTRFPLSNAADIGYWLGGSFEGRGLVTRACKALIDHGFGTLGLHRITIHCAPDNARSRAVPERLGFTAEAVLREASSTGDGYEDLVVYGLLDREWPSS